MPYTKQLNTLLAGKLTVFSNDRPMHVKGCSLEASVPVPSLSGGGGRPFSVRRRCAGNRKRQRRPELTRSESNHPERENFDTLLPPFDGIRSECAVFTSALKDKTNQGQGVALPDSTARGLSQSQSSFGRGTTVVLHERKCLLTVRNTQIGRAGEREGGRDGEGGHGKERTRRAKQEHGPSERSRDEILTALCV